MTSSSSTITSLSRSLLEASRGGQARAIDTILTSIATLSAADQLTVISTRDDSGRTPLHFGALGGHDHLVTRLLTLKANPNLQVLILLVKFL
jgi:ankyrin repeat protein